MRHVATNRSKCLREFQAFTREHYPEINTEVTADGLWKSMDQRKLDMWTAWFHSWDVSNGSRPARTEDGENPRTRLADR